MRDCDPVSRESDRVIARAMAERAAYESDCTCGAVDVEGASHLGWCDTYLRYEREAAGSGASSASA